LLVLRAERRKPNAPTPFRRDYWCYGYVWAWASGGCQRLWPSRWQERFHQHIPIGSRAQSGAHENSSLIHCDLQTGNLGAKKKRKSNVSRILDLPDRRMSHHFADWSGRYTTITSILPTQFLNKFRRGTIVGDPDAAPFRRERL